MSGNPLITFQFSVPAYPVFTTIYATSNQLLPVPQYHAYYVDEGYYEDYDEYDEDEYDVDGDIIPPLIGN
jgi:hypothetical protein